MIEEDVPPDLPEPDAPPPLGDGTPANAPAPEPTLPETRGPAYLMPDGRIDCAVRHPSLGWIRFTAQPDDPMDYGRGLHEYWLGRSAELIHGMPPDE